MLETMLKILKSIRNSFLISVLIIFNVSAKDIRLPKDVGSGNTYSKSLQKVIINDELNFISHWNSVMTDIVWDNEYKKISKYKSFFEYDKQLFKNIIKEVFNVV